MRPTALVPVLGCRMAPSSDKNLVTWFSPPAPRQQLQPLVFDERSRSVGAHDLLRAVPVLGVELDLTDWERRHSAGLVPDAVPYGLDRMRAHGVELTAAPTGWPITAAGRTIRRIGRRTGGGYDWLRATSMIPPGDVVLCWDERAGVPFALRHGRERTVVIGVIWATDNPPRSPLVRRAVRSGLARASMITVLSSAQVPALVQDLGVAPDRVAVVPFGIDVDFFTPAQRNGPDKGGGRETDGMHVVMVGNDRDRDWGTALAAFALVRRRQPSARLTVVSRTIGSDAAGVDGVRVLTRLGHDELRTLLRSADAALVMTRPNLHVSGITAALEAQACGAPVVSTGTAGMADYSGDGMTLVPPGDSKVAARALEALLTDRSAARESGEAGRLRVVAGFSTETQAARLAVVVRDGAVRAHQTG